MKAPPEYEPEVSVPKSYPARFTPPSFVGKPRFSTGDAEHATAPATTKAARVLTERTMLIEVTEEETFPRLAERNEKFKTMFEG